MAIDVPACASEQRHLAFEPLAIASDRCKGCGLCVVALGAALARRPIVSRDSARAALTSVVGEDRPTLLEANRNAFERGREVALVEPSPSA